MKGFLFWYEKKIIGFPLGIWYSHGKSRPHGVGDPWPPKMLCGKIQWSRPGHGFPGLFSHRPRNEKGVPWRHDALEWHTVLIGAFCFSFLN
jgi:hypothetical protein